MRKSAKADGLYEEFSCEGMEQLELDLSQARPNSEAEANRLELFVIYTIASQLAYNETSSDGKAHVQNVRYRSRHHSVTQKPLGRVQASSSCSTGATYPDGRPVHANHQGMPREIKPYALAGRAHDLDFEAAQPRIFSQIVQVKKLTWSDGRALPTGAIYP